jgi:hypothetical protein
MMHGMVYWMTGSRSPGHHHCYARGAQAPAASKHLTVVCSLWNFTFLEAKFAGHGAANSAERLPAQQEVDGLGSCNGDRAMQMPASQLPRLFLFTTIHNLEENLRQLVQHLALCFVLAKHGRQLLPDVAHDQQVDPESPHTLDKLIDLERSGSASGSTHHSHPVHAVQCIETCALPQVEQKKQPAGVT